MTFQKAPSCVDCSDRLMGSVAYMANEESQIQVVTDLIEGGFCKQDSVMCMIALELVIPQAMNMLAISGDMWVGDFCASQIECA